jgi:two-component system, NtrC family, response regulator HydG
MASDQLNDRPVRNAAPESTFIVSSPSMRALVTFAERAGSSEAKVLITGESGVGKDRIARIVHERSPRSSQPFVAVNCAGLTESLLESELFGHVKGSFTGAYRDKIGKLQQAHRGTLFLDEIGEMSLRMQALLLRFLENGEIQAVGSDASVVRVDVRVVAATNRNLSELIAAGQFREDLWYRVRVIHLHVPPLRERLEDIRPLATHFMVRSGRRVNIAEEAIRLLERYRWPGNVRELQNVIEQTVWLAPGDIVSPEHLPSQIQTTAQALLPVRERRTQVADELYQALVVSGYSFWEHIYPLFLSRDITRHDMRELVRRGLATTRGNYRTMLKLFGIPPRDYKRFLNFLAAHDCRADFREFRNGTADLSQRPRRILPPPSPGKQERADADGLVAQR